MLDRRHLRLLQELEREFADCDDWVAVGYVQRLIGYVADEHGIFSESAEPLPRELTMH